MSNNKGSSFQTLSIIAIGAATISSFAWYAFKKYSKSDKSAGSVSDEKSVDAAANPEKPSKSEKPDDIMSKEQLCTLYKSILDKMKMVCIQLHAVTLQAQSQIASGATTQSEVQGYMQQEFEKAMNMLENQVYVENNVTEAEVTAAADYFKDDEELLEITGSLKSLYDDCGSGRPMQLPEIPSDLTKEKVIDMVAENVKLTSDVMIAVTNTAQEKFSITAEELKKKMNATTQNEVLQYVLAEFTKQSSSVKQDIQAKYGVNDLLLNAAVQKYGESDSVFLSKIQEITIVQQEAFRKIGIA